MPAAGTGELNGRPVHLRSPAAASQAGVVYLSADRKEEGLFQNLSVRENAAFAAFPLLAPSGLVRRDDERDKVTMECAQLAVRTPSIETPVSSLSGGNQQKVLLARAMLANPSLVLIEEPTAGVDVGARAEIYRILRELAAEGTPHRYCFV